MGAKAPTVFPFASMGLVLIGMMGAGKTTVGRLCAAHLGWLFVDTDEEIVRQAGMSIEKIFEEKGEGWFREQESEKLFQYLESGERLVVSAGGGAPMVEKNWEAFRGIGLVVYLRATVSTLLSRVGGGEGRPLLKGNAEERLRKLLAERKGVYERADWIVDVDGLDVEEVVRRVVAIAQGAYKDAED